MMHAEVLPPEQQACLRQLGPAATASLAHGTVHGSVDGVKVSFLEFKPALLEPTLDWPDYGCRVAGLADLAAMKLLAVSQRGTKKGFHRCARDRQCDAA